MYNEFLSTTFFEIFTLYLVSIDESRFKNFVVPGDSLVITVRLVSHKLNFWSFDALAKIDDREVANAKFRVLANSDSLEAEKK